METDGLSGPASLRGRPIPDDHSALLPARCSDSEWDWPWNEGIGRGTSIPAWICEAPLYDMGIVFDVHGSFKSRRPSRRLASAGTDWWSGFIGVGIDEVCNPCTSHALPPLPASYSIPVAGFPISNLTDERESGRDPGIERFVDGLDLYLAAIRVRKGPKLTQTPTCRRIYSIKVSRHV